jgi:molybdate transport system substrate-binding protein
MLSMAVALICVGCGPPTDAPGTPSITNDNAAATDTTGATVAAAAAPGSEAAVAASTDVELHILCGTSFGPPMEKLVALYEKETGGRAVLAFGGSEDHLPKIKLKAGGDVFVSHTPYMQYTRDADAMLREEIVGYLAPVLVVRKGNPKQLKSIEDLAQPGLRVVLPNPEFSTCGEMVDKMLEAKGIKDKVMENVGNDLVKHHATVGNQLKIGARDAGIMWNGVAHNFLDAIEIVPTPYEYKDEVQVGVMGLSYTKNKEAVEHFLDFVREHGNDVFAEFGYVK